MKRIDFASAGFVGTLMKRAGMMEVARQKGQLAPLRDFTLGATLLAQAAEQANRAAQHARDRTHAMERLASGEIAALESQLSGYRQSQLLGPRYAYARLSYQARLARVPMFEGVYGGLAYELADMPQTVAENDRGLFRSGTGYLAADTPIGTAYFGFGYADRDNRALYLYVGKPF